MKGTLKSNRNFVQIFQTNADYHIKQLKPGPHQHRFLFSPPPHQRCTCCNAGQQATLRGGELRGNVWGGSGVSTVCKGTLHSWMTILEYGWLPQQMGEAFMRRIMVAAATKTPTEMRHIHALYEMRCFFAQKTLWLEWSKYWHLNVIMLQA